MVLGFALQCAAANAAVVSVTEADIGGGGWRLTYVVQGLAPTDGLDGLTIYFDASTYGALSNLSVGPDWDPLLVQGDASISADGFADLLALGGTISGAITTFTFSVDVQYLLARAPGPQTYEFYIQNPFRVTASGESQVSTAVGTVPEPLTAQLVALALLASGWVRRQQSSDIGAEQQSLSGYRLAPHGEARCFQGEVYAIQPAMGATGVQGCLVQSCSCAAQWLRRWWQQRQPTGAVR